MDLVDEDVMGLMCESADVIYKREELTDKIERTAKTMDAVRELSSLRA